jgi:hypothetical protein
MSKDKTLPLVNKEKMNNMEIEYLHYPSNGQTLLMLHATGFYHGYGIPLPQGLMKNMDTIYMHPISVSTGILTPKQGH